MSYEIGDLLMYADFERMVSWLTMVKSVFVKKNSTQVCITHNYVTIFL